MHFRIKIKTSRFQVGIGTIDCDNCQIHIFQVSKKIFSFKDPARTFGFVKPGLINFDEMEKRLNGVWSENGWEFLTGDKIIDELFAGKDAAS